MTTPNSAFAAVNADRAAYERFARASETTDPVAADQEGRVITKSDEDEYDAADLAERASALALVRTLPTTVEGTAEYLVYVSERFSGREHRALLAQALRGLELSSGGKRLLRQAGGYVSRAMLSEAEAEARVQ